MAGRRGAWFALLAVGLVGWIFRDAILHGYVLGQGDILFDLLPWQPYRPAGWRVRVPIFSDATVVFYPFVHHAREAIFSGQFPLWWSSPGGGRPFFAAYQTSLLSPFAPLEYLVPFPWSLAVDAGARLIAGGAGMYLLLRRWDLAPFAAVFGGIAYLLNPFSVVWLEHPLSAVAACLPWVLLAIERSVDGSDARGAAWVALAIAATLLAGHPETAFKVLLFAGAFGCLRALWSPRRIRNLSLLAAGAGLGLLVTMVQTLPFLEYASHSRVLAARADSTGPMLTSPPAAFATAVVPEFYGHPRRRRFALGASNYAEQQAYPGLIVWLCAPLALLHRRLRRYGIFLLGAAIAAFLIMYGTPLANVATWLIPPLRVAALTRFGLIAIAGLAMAAAIGVDAAFGDRERSGRVIMSSIVVTVAVALAATAALFLSGQHDLLVQAAQWGATTQAVTRAAVILACSAIVLLLAVDLPRRLLVALLIGILAVDLMIFADGLHPQLPRALSFPPVAELDFIKRDTGVHRVAGWGLALPPNTASVYGLQDFRTYEGLGLRRYDEFLQTGFHFNGTAFELVNVSTPHLLDFLNVKYIVAPKDVELPPDRFKVAFEGASRVYVNERVQGRAFLVDHYVVAKDNEARRLLRNGTDLTRVAVLEEALPADLTPSATQGDPGSASVTRYEDGAVEISTQADGRRLLVMSDVHYPGWEATIDGAPATIHLANYAFRGVSVPGGSHRIVFRYRPRSVFYGAIVSLLACGVVGALFAARRR